MSEEQTPEVVNVIEFYDPACDMVQLQNDLFEKSNLAQYVVFGDQDDHQLWQVPAIYWESFQKFVQPNNFIPIAASPSVWAVLSLPGIAWTHVVKPDDPVYIWIHPKQWEKFQNHLLVHMTPVEQRLQEYERLIPTPCVLEAILEYLIEGRKERLNEVAEVRQQIKERHPVEK